MDDHITELIPGYALGSLDKEERLLADRHLKKCERCRSELRAYSEVVGELAYALPTSEPSQEIKQRIMTEVGSRERQVRKNQSLTLWHIFLNFSRIASPAWAVAGIVLILVLGAGNLFMWDRINDLEQARTTINLGVINLHGTETTPDAVGVIVIGKDGEHGTLIVDRLPVLDDSEQYQLWLLVDGERTSGGVFSVGDDGYGYMYVKSKDPLASFSSFGVTVEPTGGSPGPTGAKVLGSDA